MRLNFWAVSGLSNAIGVVALGVWVYVKGREPRVKRSFVILNFNVALWCFSYFIWQISETEEMALFWARALTAGSVSIAPSFLNFVFNFLDLRTINRKRILTVAYAFSLLFLILSFTPLFVKGVSAKLSFPFWPEPGFLYSLYPVHFFVCFIYSWCLLRKAIMATSDYARANQIKYMLFGSIIGVIGGATNWPLWWNISIPPYGNSAVVVYVGIITYAIIKHRLMDISIVFRKGFIYSLLITTITLVYLLIVSLAERTFQTAIGYQSLPVTVFALLTIALLFQPLKDRIQQFVDFNFFKGTLESLAKEKQRLQNEVRRTDQLRIASTIATSLAHEIKNPITSIKTFTNYLPERKNEVGFTEKYKKIVGDELNRIEVLIKDLLDFSKPKPPKLEKVNIHKILDETFNLLTHDLLMKNITAITLYNEKKGVF